MKPIGPLMIEHRLTDRMLDLIRREISNLRGGAAPVDISFAGQVVDFFRTYVDLCHHGKEEDILFRALAGKKMSSDHRGIMDELIEEHRTARTVVAALDKAKDMHCAGSDRRSEIKAGYEKIVEIYPPHIEKEDKHFFFPCLEYLGKDEQDTMLAEMQGFDAKLFHHTYVTIIERLETAGRGEKDRA
ncbi:MAG: hemerythrin domain-containing protein [Candidatus Sulfobium sp.]|jgi:hemerythrin-like domain-containing protein